MRWKEMQETVNRVERCHYPPEVSRGDCLGEAHACRLAPRILDVCDCGLKGERVTHRRARVHVADNTPAPVSADCHGRLRLMLRLWGR